MSWTKRIALGLAVALVVASGVVAVSVALWVRHVKAEHPRDAASFIEHLDGKIMSRGQSVLAPLDDHALIAEGDRACEWLAAQPRALWRTDIKYRFGSLVERYQETPTVDGSLKVKNSSPSDVRTMAASTAWTTLCGAAWEFHKPHYIFSSPSD